MSAVDLFVAAYRGQDVAIGVARARAGVGVPVKVFTLDGVEHVFVGEDARRLLSQAAAFAPRVFVSDPAALAVSHEAELRFLGVDVSGFCSWLVASRVLAADVSVAAPLSAFAALFGAASATDRVWADRLVEEDLLWRRLSAMSGVQVDVRALSAALRQHRGNIDRFGQATGVNLMAADVDRHAASWVRRNGGSVEQPEDARETGWCHPTKVDPSGMTAAPRRQFDELFAPAYRSVSRVQKLLEVQRALTASDGRVATVRPQVSVNAAATGRMTMRLPSLQSLAADLRPIVVAPAGRVLVSADHSGAEIVTLAALLGMPELADRDVYAEIAERCGMTRSKTKILTLAWLYGQTHGSRANALGSEELAHRLEQGIRETIPQVVALRDELQARSRAGERLYTLGGRRLAVPTGGRHYTALNRVLQGSARDAFGEAVDRVAALGDDFRLVLPMHDEVLVAVPAGMPERVVTAALREAMAVDLPGGLVRMRSEIAVLGASWGPSEA